MPRFMNKNQVFLVSTREDVVLFCNEVLHKYTTVQRVYDFNCVSHNTDGIIIYDACKEAETLSFLVKAHKFTCPFIIFISPLLNEDIQRALRLFTNLCFSSITNMVTKRSFADFFSFPIIAPSIRQTSAFSFRLRLRRHPNFHYRV